MLEIGSSDYLDSPRFSPRERAAVLWAEHVSRNTARNRDDVFEEVRHQFNDAEIVELTGVSGLFGQNNRFQDSMRLPIEEQSEVNKIRHTVRVDPNRIRTYLIGLIEHWPNEFPQPVATRRETVALPATVTPAAHSQSSLGAPRVPLLCEENASEDARRFMRATRQLHGGLTHAVRVWAHIPHAAKLSFPFMAAMERDGAGSILPATTRLMALIKLHHVHTAPYLLAHHTALARATGLSETELTALASETYLTSPPFSRNERAAITWAAHVARNSAKRHNDAFEELKACFSNAEIVELTGLCALFSNIDLVYNALRVPLESDAELKALEHSVRVDPDKIRIYLNTLLADWPQELPTPNVLQR